MGRDDNRALPGLAGGRAPARAFHDLMIRAVANRPVEQFQHRRRRRPTGRPSGDKPDLVRAAQRRALRRSRRQSDRARAASRRATTSPAPRPGDPPKDDDSRRPADQNGSTSDTWLDRAVGRCDRGAAAPARRACATRRRRRASSPRRSPDVQGLRRGPIRCSAAPCALAARARAGFGSASSSCATRAWKSGPWFRWTRCATSCATVARRTKSGARISRQL